jgi:hypothetical protein
MTWSPRSSAHGTPESIRSLVRAHLAAGADHVVLLPPGGIDKDLATGVAELECLATAVLAAG